MLVIYRAHMCRAGFTERTLKDRMWLLERVERDLGQPLLEATKGELEGWLDGRVLSNQSRYTYLSHLHAFYTWAITEEVIDVAPTARIVRPRLPRRVPRPIGSKLFSEALADAPANLRCWMLLAGYEGLRCCEIARLEVEDLLLGSDPPMLLVKRGKGDHQRAIPLHPDVWNALRQNGIPIRGPIFRLKGKPTTPNYISWRMSRYLRSIDIPATAHQFRHWFGTQVYAESKDLRMTQELMGHASPVTTSRYVAFEPSRAHDVIRRLGL